MRRRTKICAALFVALTACVLFAHDISVMSSSAYSDFLPDYVSGREWRAGGDPYGLTRPALRTHLSIDSNDIDPRQRNPHPPVQIVLLAPLSRLPYRSARLTLLGISALAAVAAAAAFLRGIGRPWWWGFGALSLPIIHAELFYGQVNTISLLLFVLAWRALDRGNERGAGAFLGIAAALKLFPVLMVLPLLRAKRRVAAGWLVAVVVGGTLFASAMLGIGSALRWLTLAMPQNTRNVAPSTASPASWVFRAFGYSNWIAVALMVACCYVAWRSTFWKAVPWVILASPIAWAGYGILALPLMVTQAPIAAGALVAGLSIGLNPLVTAVLVFLALYGIEPEADRADRIRVIDLAAEPAGSLASALGGTTDRG